MALALLLAAQVATSTEAAPRLRTELEHALWARYVRTRTRAELAESKVRELLAEKEISSAARRMEVRTATLTCAPTLTCPPCQGDCPMMTTPGFGVCAAAGVGFCALCFSAGTRSCGVNVIGVPQ